MRAAVEFRTQDRGVVKGCSKMEGGFNYEHLTWRRERALAVAGPVASCRSDFLNGKDLYFPIDRFEIPQLI